MKEHGPQGFNPHEKLTPEARNPYADGGDTNMAEGNAGSMENKRENEHQRSNIPSDENAPHQQRERAWDPIDSPLTENIDIPASDPGQTPSPEQLQAKLAWLRVYDGRWPTNPDERQTLGEMIKSGQLPPTQLLDNLSSQDDSIPQEVLQVNQPLHERSNPPTAEEYRKILEDAGLNPTQEDIDKYRATQESDNRNDPSKPLSPEEDAYIKRKEAEVRNAENVYGETKIRSVQDLALEIMRFEPTEGYQTGQEFELINEQGEFQQQNFVRWVRHWMMHWHSEDPDTAWEFDKEVGLRRDYSHITIQQMVNNPERYFKDESKMVVNDAGREVPYVYRDLVDEIKREVWLFGASRKFDIEYRQVMGSDEDLAKTLLKNYYGNTFTKTVWDKSSLHWILNQAQEFKGNETQDAKVGRAINTAYLTYYNLSDRESLAEILGDDAPLLHADTVKAKIKELAESKGMTPEEFIDPSEWEKLSDDNPDSVINFINIFNLPGKNYRAVQVTRELIKDSLIKKYDLYVTKKNGERVVDQDTVDYAETFANSMARWTGAGARNDTNSVGYDAWTKFQDTDDYRLKQPEWTRGGGFGNPYTVRVLKQVGRDLMTAVFTETRDPNKVGEFKNKTPLQVLMEIEKLGIDDYETFKKTNSQLIFPENTMRSFTIDHYNRAFGVYQQIMKSEEIKLEKFTKWDYINGLQFERGPFEEALKEKFFKPMRYAYSTYAMLDYAQEVRAKVTEKDSKGKKVIRYRTMHMAEAMFGREMLHLPQFLKDPDHPPKINSEDWADHIDWAKVNSKDGKVYIWRQMALTRMAAELYAHRDRHSTDPKYNLLYYQTVIDALEQLPNDIAGDEFSLQSSKAIGRFFTKDDIKWLREKASTETWRLYRNQATWDISGGFLKGVGEAIKDTGKAIAKF